jgi:hypothetical protein
VYHFESLCCNLKSQLHIKYGYHVMQLGLYVHRAGHSVTDVCMVQLMQVACEDCIPVVYIYLRLTVKGVSENSVKKGDS